MAGWVGPFAAKLTTEEEMIQHIAVTEAVHSVQVPIYGSATNARSVAPKICLQILHTGRYAYHPFAVSASSTQSPISPFKARAMSKGDIAQTVRDFTNTALLAREAGYDGVEIMGSEGYLLSQFLSPSTNLRTDDYGGTSFANRSRFPLEIVKSVREATGPDFIIVFRISLLDLVAQGGGTTWEESLELAAALEKAGVTILNTGIGWHEVRFSFAIGIIIVVGIKVSIISLNNNCISLFLNIPGSSSNHCDLGSQRCLYFLYQTIARGQCGQHPPRFDESHQCSRYCRKHFGGRRLRFGQHGPAVIGRSGLYEKGHESTSGCDQYLYCMQSSVFGPCLCRKDGLLSSQPQGVS